MKIEAKRDNLDFSRPWRHFIVMIRKAVKYHTSFAEMSPHPFIPHVYLERYSNWVTKKPKKKKGKTRHADNSARV